MKPLLRLHLLIASSVSPIGSFWNTWTVPHLQMLGNGHWEHCSVDLHRVLEAMPGVLTAFQIALTFGAFAAVCGNSFFYSEKCLHWAQKKHVPSSESFPNSSYYFFFFSWTVFSSYVDWILGNFHCVYVNIVIISVHISRVFVNVHSFIIALSMVLMQLLDMAILLTLLCTNTWLFVNKFSFSTVVYQCMNLFIS